MTQRLTGGAWAAGLLLLLALWVTTRPDLGIHHDAELYMAQALSWIHPERYAGDLFFAYGSQDGFTLFSALYAPVVDALGPQQAHRAVRLIGHAAWLCGLVALTCAIFGRTREALLAAAGAVVLAPYYSSLHVFRYGEAFVTPRVFAEALAMLAIAAAVRGRWAAAGLALLAGAAVHPLMTLTGAAVVGLVAARREPRLWLLAGVGALAVVGLALTGVEPFGRLLERFDDDVFAIVYERCAFGFISRWTWQDVAQLLPPLCFAAIGLRLATAAERPVLGAAIVAALIGVSATALGADLARNVLITNLQCLRALWLLVLLSNAFAVVVLLRLPRSGITQSLLMAALLFNAIECWVGYVALLSAAFSVCALAALVWETPRARSVPRWLTGVITALIMLALLYLCFVAHVLIGRKLELEGDQSVLLASAALVLGIAGIACVTTLPRRLAQGIGSAAAVLALAGAVSASDRQTDWVRFATSDEVPGELHAFLSDAGTVYWDGGITLQWIKLRSASYYSCLQGSGIMFFPGTARLYAARSAGLAVLNTHDFGSTARDVCPRLRPDDADGPTDIAQVVAACRAQPDLDTIVLRTALPGAPPARNWRPPTPYVTVTPKGERQEFDSFHLYRCADLRQPEPTP